MGVYDLPLMIKRLDSLFVIGEYIEDEIGLDKNIAELLIDVKKQFKLAYKNRSTVNLNNSQCRKCIRELYALLCIYDFVNYLLDKRYIRVNTKVESLYNNLPNFAINEYEDIERFINELRGEEDESYNEIFFFI